MANDLQIINDVEEGNYSCIDNLVNWSITENKKILKTNWNCYDLINEIKSRVMYVALKTNITKGKLDEYVTNNDFCYLVVYKTDLYFF